MRASKIKREGKAQILNRMIQSKEMLLEWGFNATFIETEDIHLARRAKDTDFEYKIRQWIDAQNRNDGVFVPQAIQSEVEAKIKQIQDRTKHVIEVQDKKKKQEAKNKIEAKAQIYPAPSPSKPPLKYKEYVFYTSKESESKAQS